MAKFQFFLVPILLVSLLAEAASQQLPRNAVQREGTRKGGDTANTISISSIDTDNDTTASTSRELYLVRNQLNNNPVEAGIHTNLLKKTTTTTTTRQWMVSRTISFETN